MKLKFELADKDMVVSSSDGDGGGKLIIEERKVSLVSSSRHYILAIVECGVPPFFLFLSSIQNPRSPYHSNVDGYQISRH